MAGLAGWAVAAAKALDDGGVLPMLQALAHRHGEEETLLACTDVRRTQQVVLGASLRDMATGIALALDGTLANAAALRDTLGRKGFAFAGKSSVEVLLRAYQYWDKDVVRHLRGAFAFTVWDPRKDRLMLARDRFGEKPLYVEDRDEGLFFASEAKALLAAPGARAQIDLKALRACVAAGYVPGEATLFRGIRRLAPGTYAMWQFGRLQATRYWVAPDRQPWRAHTAGGEDAFARALGEATAPHAGAGVLLSGGVDSAVLVALLAQGGGAVKTFSLGFEGDKESELPQAAALARHFGAAHHEIVVKAIDLVPDLPDLVERHDGPVAPSVLAIHRLATEAARAAPRVISGDGCDEVVGGYRRLVAERFHPGFCDALARRGEGIAARLLPGAAPAAAWNDADPQASVLRRALYTEQTTRLPDRLLERNDRAPVAIGMPYVDHHLAEHVSALRDEDRVRGLATKWVVREAARKLLPHGFACRKGGFRLPVRDWLRNDLGDTLAEHLQSGESQTRRYYDTDVLDRLVREHVQRKSNHDKTLWTLLNLEIWHRRYRPG
jgi:asparagine synthase (glutamine-hydrolysing)